VARGDGPLQARAALPSLALDAGEPIRATCPVPDDLRGLWQRLSWWDDALRAVPELALPATIAR
jgi:hypothetical protein